MKIDRRRVQFSLLSGLAALLIASAALGVYIRWPYYRAGQTLDESEGDRSSPGWALVRESLINDTEFRETLDTQKPFKVASSALPEEVYFVYGMTKVWRIKTQIVDGQRKVNELVSMPYEH